METKTRTGPEEVGRWRAYEERRRDRWVEMEEKVEKEVWAAGLTQVRSVAGDRSECWEKEEEEEGLSRVVRSHWVSSSASCSASLFCSSPETTTET